MPEWFILVLYCKYLVMNELDLLENTNNKKGQGSYLC